MAAVTDEEKKVAAAAELAATDMDPEELAKAIDKSAGDATQKPAAKDSTKAKADSDSEDQGVQIVVKRKSTPPAEKMAEPEPSSEADTKDKEPTISHHTKTITPINKDLGEESKVDDNQPTEANTPTPADGPAESTATESTETPATTEVPTTETQSDATEAEASANAKPTAETDSTEPKSPSPAPTPVPPVADKTGAGSELDKQVKRLKQADAEPADDGLQKPTVYDTTQYHLPIKTNNKRYISGSVSWLILAIVLVAAAVYVMYELGVIELSDLGL
jgi:hypothetical protein